MEVGKKGKVHVEDIVFLIRKDPKKYARVKVRNYIVLVIAINILFVVFLLCYMLCHLTFPCFF